MIGIFYRSFYCIHVKILLSLLPESINQLYPCKPLEKSVDILSIQPFLVGVCDGTSHGLIRHSKVGKEYSYHCCTCVCTHQCSHVEYFREWTTMKKTNLQTTRKLRYLKNQSIYNNISYLKIPYPLTDELCRLHRAYEAGLKCFPTERVPQFKPEQKCIHNNCYDDKDPVTSKWVEATKVTIYKQSSTIISTNRKVYYRPAKGCSCKLLIFMMDKKTFCLILTINIYFIMISFSNASI